MAACDGPCRIQTNSSRRSGRLGVARGTGRDHAASQGLQRMCLQVLEPQLANERLVGQSFSE
jgi:hypothetical protein